MVSLKDIAKKCNVSVATVSKALNDQKDVGDDTKQRVRSAAESLGYHPNAAARALKTGQSYNLGVLFWDEAGSGLTHEYFSEVLNGVKEEAEARGYDITFINNRFGKRNSSFAEHCKVRAFDGVAIVCAKWDDASVEELLSGPIPKVTIDYEYYKCTAISSNNMKGMEDLLRFIYSRGHRKIAYIHGQGNNYVTTARLRSFQNTAKQLGLTIPPEYIRDGRYLETEKVALETRKLLDLKDPPTCIIYPDDTSLIGGLNVISERNLRVPEDISVAGYDGTRLSQMLSPKICTIHQDAEAIGAEAARRLISLIEKPKTTLIERVVLEGSLIPGESVAQLSTN